MRGLPFGERGTGCRSIKMRACAFFRELRRMAAMASAERVIRVAICAARLDEFRSLQHTDTIAVRCNRRVSLRLRPELRSIVAVQFRPNGNKALRRLEIRQPRKKFRGFGSLPDAGILVSQGKRPGIGGLFCAKAASRRHQDDRSSAVVIRGGVLVTGARYAPSRRCHLLRWSHP